MVARRHQVRDPFLHAERAETHFCMWKGQRKFAEMLVPLLYSTGTIGLCELISWEHLQGSQGPPLEVVVQGLVVLTEHRDSSSTEVWKRGNLAQVAFSEVPC